jgi:nucleotidyltransferase/DNA polymerase involved in DNA repair
LLFQHLAKWTAFWLEIRFYFIMLLVQFFGYEVSMLSLWIPELPFQLAVGRDKKLSGRPLAFLSPSSSPVPTLWLVNKLAEKDGVGAGEPVGVALKVCPGLQVLDPAPKVWREAQASLREFLTKWAHQGRLGRMGEALIELHGTQYAKDTANTILKELLDSLGWTAHSGLSSSGTASWMAAKQERGVESVREGSEASYLAPHPVSALPHLEKGTVYRLNKLGLFEIRDIQPVPVDMLSHFMQKEKAKAILQCARGEDRPKLPALTGKLRGRHAWRLSPGPSQRRRSNVGP